MCQGRFSRPKAVRVTFSKKSRRYAEIYVTFQSIETFGILPFRLNFLTNQKSAVFRYGLGCAPNFRYGLGECVYEVSGQWWVQIETSKYRKTPSPASCDYN